MILALLVTITIQQKETIIALLFHEPFIEKGFLWICGVPFSFAVFHTVDWVLLKHL